MNLNDFDENIDPKIVDRGYTYFLDELVNGPELIDDGVWLATVYGSDAYRVEIRTEPKNSDTILDWQCDCPYDYGPVCKHVVAVLYMMRESGISRSDSANIQGISTAKDNIEEIFKNTSEEDLQEFILSCIKSMDGFKNRFLGHFADRVNDSPVQQYRQIIRNYSKAAQGRNGFIDYHSVSTLIRPLWELNEKANTLLDTGKVRESMVLCQTLIEEVSNIHEIIDDSGGGAWDVVGQAFDTLVSVAESTTSSTIKDELFGWAVQEFPLQKYHDFGFGSHFLNLLPLLVSSAKQEERFFTLLDRQIEREKEKSWSDYSVTRLIKAKIEYLHAQEREQEVLDLLETHSRFYDFREQLVDRALDNKAFEKAKNLCRDGIEIAKEQNHYGILIRWREKMFQIARMENDVPEMRKWAKKLYFKGNRSMQWYRALKSTYSEQEWPEKCEELIDRIKGPDKKVRYGQVNTIAQIFAEEEYTGRLLKLLQLNANNISFVDHYANILRKEYPDELMDLYEGGISDFAQQTGRKNYRELAGWLRKMRKINGGDERAYSLFKKLLCEYNNRPAMRDDFMKAFPEWKE